MDSQSVKGVPNEGDIWANLGILPMSYFKLGQMAGSEEADIVLWEQVLVECKVTCSETIKRLAKFLQAYYVENNTKWSW